MKNLKRSVNKVISVAFEKLSAIEKLLFNKRNAIAAGLVAANMVGMTAFCSGGAPAGNIETIVNLLGRLFFGCIWLLGAFQAVMGFVAVAKAANDEDQGGDQNGIGKGVKKAIIGLALLFGPAIILTAVGYHPLSLGTDLFGGM